MQFNVGEALTAVLPLLMLGSYSRDVLEQFTLCPQPAKHPENGIQPAVSKMLDCLGGRREGDSLRSEKLFVAEEKWTQILWSLRQHTNCWATFPLLFWNLCCKPEEQFVVSLFEFYDRTVQIARKESLFANSQKNKVSNNFFFLNGPLIPATLLNFKFKRTFQPITILILVNLGF